MDKLISAVRLVDELSIHPELYYGFISDETMYLLCTTEPFNLASLYKYFWEFLVAKNTEDHCKNRVRNYR